MTNRLETESTILKISDDLRGQGKPFPTAVKDIPDFPFTTYENLSRAFGERSMLLQRFSVHYDNGIFELFASRSQQTLSSIYLVLAGLLPLACIVLAFLYSWWWLAGIPSMFFALGKSKRLYNHVILSSAFDSELYFCFLYVMGQVCVTPSDFNTSYYWKHR